jgi:ATP-dependent DNA helicase DinG
MASSPRLSPDPDTLPPLVLSPEAAVLVREEIRRARGREVSFLAEVAEDRTLIRARAVARGNRAAVLVAARDAREGSVVLHNHPSGLMEPSDADLAVAAELYERGLGTAIVDNEATRLYVVVEPPRPREVRPLDPEEVDRLLGPQGPLARELPGFEDRPGQRAMAHLVAGRYNGGGLALVEAGTGTGKSMAYLLPAALWALENEERTVISTNTINLQEQLVEKDLPLLERALGRELRWALVKGRGNYLSIRRARLAAATAHSLFEDDRSGEIQGLLEWTETTADGSLADLSTPPSPEVWEEVRSDPDICLRARCPHFQSCFFQRARRRAASAEILVVNHHLLFADLAVRRVTDNYTQSAVLPPYRHLILDEGHNVEEVATDHLGVQVTRRGLYRLLARMEHRGKGVLADLREQLARDPERGSAQEHLSRLDRRVRGGLERSREALEPFLAPLDRVVERGEGDSLRLGGEDGMEPREEVDVREGMGAFLFQFRRLAREVGELRDRLAEDEAWVELLEGRLLDLRSIQGRLDAAALGVQRVLDPGEEESRLVRWLERKGKVRRGLKNLALAAAPIQVGPILRSDLFGRLNTVVVTSATLTTRAGFEYLRSRLGLEVEVLEAEGEGPEVVEEVVPSPFDFETQSLLAVPADLREARGAGEGFQEDTARVVREVAAVTGGGIFVLFTAHRALRQVGELLRAREEALPGPLFLQGEMPRGRLLARFTTSGRGILLGTSSFWEGVDVPGDPLRALILQKLPFQVPTEPIVAARMEAIAARGGDPFWRYTLPEAALRLKQGFGRLIRTREDRGVVLILDNRILTRRYGPFLRQSLPPAPLVKGPWEVVRRALEVFYADGEPGVPDAS